MTLRNAECGLRILPKNLRFNPHSAIHNPQ
jgi:hypothetical protein